MCTIKDPRHILVVLQLCSKLCLPFKSFGQDNAVPDRDVLSCHLVKGYIITYYTFPGREAIVSANLRLNASLRVVCSQCRVKLPYVDVNDSHHVANLQESRVRLIVFYHASVVFFTFLALDRCAILATMCLCKLVCCHSPCIASDLI